MIKADQLGFALGFATAAHIKQKRKYTGDPYIVHPIAVYTKLQDLGFHEDELIAALLHDVVEDTDVTLQEIEENFGTIIARLVEHLTDVYTKEAFPELNRKERKRLEIERIAKIPGKAKSIKLADILDNTASIVDNDPDFSVVYLPEIEKTLAVLGEGDERLVKEAYALLQESQLKLAYGQ